MTQIYRNDAAFSAAQDFASAFPLGFSLRPMLLGSVLRGFIFC
jgi:hypothetical protein